MATQGTSSARRRLARVALGLALLGAALGSGVVGASVWRRAHSPRLVLATGIARPTFIKFVDGERRLAVFHGDNTLDVDVWELETGALVARFSLGENEDARFRVSTGDRILFSVDTTLALWTSQGEHLWSREWPCVVEHVGVSRDGSTVVVQDVDRRLTLLSGRTGEVTDVLGPLPPKVFAKGLSVLPAGDVLVRTILSDTVAVVSRQPGAPPRTFTFPGEFVTLAASGDLIVEGAPGFLVLSPADGAERSRLTIDESESAVAGSLQTFAEAVLCRSAKDDAYVVRSLETGRIRRRLPQNGSTRALLSSSGDLLAIPFPDGRVEIWEIPPP